MQSVMGTIPGMTATAPPDPSQKIPPEARGKVRRKKKASAGGRRVCRGRVGGRDDRGELSEEAGSDAVKDEGGGGEGGSPTAKDCTFVTNRDFSGDDGVNDGFPM